MWENRASLSAPRGLCCYLGSLVDRIYLYTISTPYLSLFFLWIGIELDLVWHSLLIKGIALYVFKARKFYIGLAKQEGCVFEIF